MSYKNTDEGDDPLGRYIVMYVTALLGIMVLVIIICAIIEEFL